ncbi:MAG: DUF3820 family protein [candidate division NC10 bacterium]|nr:DUF3820 family protein [candidate division NC10 bacterium]
MPFGKYRGRAVGDLPDAYLQWLTTIPLREPLRSAVQSEVDARQRRQVWGDRGGQPMGPLPSYGVDRSVALELVGAGVKVLAKRYHPDLVGGDGESMKQVNLSAEWLRTLITYARQERQR